MLKKTALSLFGLVAMLIFVNPPQAHAGVVIAIGPAYPRPVYVRPYRYVAPVPFVAYRPAPLLLWTDVFPLCSSGLGLSSGLLCAAVYRAAACASRVCSTPSVLEAVRVSTD